MSYEDTNFSLGHRAHGINIHHDKQYDYHDGYVITPSGLVGVYAQGGVGAAKHTRLDFAIGGRQYIREFHKQRLTPRGMVTAATRFAAEVVSLVEDTP